MKTIIIYQSSTGFTKQYAEWIAQDLSCQAVEIKKISGKDIAEADIVVYGGWILGNMIMGLDKLRKMNPKKLVIFAVGITPDGDEVRKNIRTQNAITNEPFFYFEGGMRYEKLGFMHKSMLKMVRGMVAKKEDKTEQDEYMLQVIGTSFDHSNRTKTKALTELVVTEA